METIKTVFLVIGLSIATASAVLVFYHFVLAVTAVKNLVIDCIDERIERIRKERSE